MIFENLVKSSDLNELILVEGAFCRYHLRKDGQLTIYEIFILPEYRGRGLGREILCKLESSGADSIFAKCPSDLISNGWYQHMGFTLEGVEELKSGRSLNLWRKKLK